MYAVYYVNTYLSEDAKYNVISRKATYQNILKGLEDRHTQKHTEKKIEPLLKCINNFIYKCSQTERLPSFWRKFLVYKL